MSINTDAVMTVAIMIATTCLGGMGILGWISWREDQAGRRAYAEFERKLEELFRR